MRTAAALNPSAAARRDVLWEHCRNSLGTARLLLHEGRPTSFVVTACRMAVESACRAALEEAGLAFDGDLQSSLRRLGAIGELTFDESGSGEEHLAAAERVVGLVASYLKSVAPQRRWGY